MIHNYYVAFVLFSPGFIVTLIMLLVYEAIGRFKNKKLVESMYKFEMNRIRENEDA